MKLLGVVAGLYRRYNTVWTSTDVAEGGGFASSPPPWWEEVHAQVSHLQGFHSRSAPGANQTREAIRIQTFLRYNLPTCLVSHVLHQGSPTSHAVFSITGDYTVGREGLKPPT